jgi:hypothetical protein
MTASTSLLPINLDTEIEPVRGKLERPRWDSYRQLLVALCEMKPVHRNQAKIFSTSCDGSTKKNSPVTGTVDARGNGAGVCDRNRPSWKSWIKLHIFFRNRHGIDFQFPLNGPDVNLNSKVHHIGTDNKAQWVVSSGLLPSWCYLNASFLKQMRFMRLFILHLASTFTSCVDTSL